MALERSVEARAHAQAREGRPWRDGGFLLLLSLFRPLMLHQIAHVETFFTSQEAADALDDAPVQDAIVSATEILDSLGAELEEDTHKDVRVRVLYVGTE